VDLCLFEKFELHSWRRWIYRAFTRETDGHNVCEMMALMPRCALLGQLIGEYKSCYVVMNDLKTYQFFACLLIAENKSGEVVETPVES
jgi:hypothetical protein